MHFFRRNVIMADTQVLFWLLIIGILFYLYVDLRLARMKDEMKFNMLVLERVLQNALHGVASHNSNKSNPPKEYPSGWNAPPMAKPMQVQKPSGRPTPVYMVDDILPSKEEMAREIGMPMDHNWAPQPNSDAFDPLNLNGNSFAPLPEDYFKR